MGHTGFAVAGRQPAEKPAIVSRGDSGAGKSWDNLLTPQEAAACLGIALKTVYNWASSRRLPSVKIGRALRFEKAALDRVITAGRQHAHLEVALISRPHGAPSEVGKQ